jgi:pyruvate dehydrogenase E1 component
MMVRTPPETEPLDEESFDVDPLETSEWLDSLEAVLRTEGPDRARFLIETLIAHADKARVRMPSGITTPYLNTIPVEDQPLYPGDRELERRIKSIIRWNALAMVVRANKNTNVGGHISTFASAATLYEVGFNHFFRGRTDHRTGDIIYFQGHASPGMYARAFLEGRLTEQNLKNFRQELQPGGGLSSYPHPWLMPSFWQFPTVSMGLGPIMSIYQARFNRYLQDRNLAGTDDVKVWAFLGDGECDEPETLGAISLAGREQLDNLIWVINCNLQRLDGPVRGNGKIIQELEGNFRGAGWNVIKVIWGSGWDPLLAADKSGALGRRMAEVVDGEYQSYLVKGGAFIREHFFNSPELKRLVEHLSNEEIERLPRGGHDPLKVHAAYKKANEIKGQPSVVLVKTIKGYGIPGEGGEGKNTTHQLKKLSVKVESGQEVSGEERAQREMHAALRKFRDRFSLPIAEAELDKIPFYKPPDDSPEMKYLRNRRKVLGGYQPARNTDFTPSNPPKPETFKRLHEATPAGKGQSTTLSWVSLMHSLMKDPNVGKFIVPIVPDEGQTFGMPPLYNQFGIYSHVGQLYEPVDAGSMTMYRESRTGQVLQEGITEAGGMSSFIAAATAYSAFGINTIPFFVYYSMFGFQRIGDLIWAAADSRARGFLMGATAGRTTLNGEGLQHEDGHSHLAALTVPNCRAYDPAFAYELAVIIEEGIQRMFVKSEDVFYYLTVYNESIDMPAMPEGVRDGILKGLYPFRTVPAKAATLARSASEGLSVQLLGSGVILNEVLRAQKLLSEKYGVGSTVHSATSYQELRRDCLECERWNRLHPDQKPRMSYVQQVLGKTKGPIIASSDYMRAVPEQIAPYVDGRLLALGTDGFGRSETRSALRRFFEIDAEHIAVASLYALAQRGEIERSVVQKAIVDLGIKADNPAPWTV